MSNPELLTEEFCKSLMEQLPEDRYERLKKLDGNELFCEVTRMQPSFFQEFMWFEKRTELASTLVETVSMARIQEIADSQTEDIGPTPLTELVNRWAKGDEFWRFEACPGDKGYALVRDGQIIDYCIIEITCL